MPSIIAICARVYTLQKEQKKRKEHSSNMHMGCTSWARVSRRMRSMIAVCVLASNSRQMRT